MRRSYQQLLLCKQRLDLEQRDGFSGTDDVETLRQGVRVDFATNPRTVIDGPFAETKELIAGFWL